MIDLYDKGSKKFSWWQDWRGECVAIIASGHSTKTAEVQKLKNRIHCIVINENYQLCPWADILYSCDTDWWRLRWKETQSFKGIKLAFGAQPVDMIKDLHHINIRQQHNIYVDEFLFDQPGAVGSGGNSGFQMVNLSAQFGATGIGLVGFDMRIYNSIHWHGSHPSPLRNPDAGQLDVWCRKLDGNAHVLKEQDIDVVNCSSISALTKFPKMTIDEMLERWSL